MAIFDESKVINALHPEKAEIGKKYWFSDNLAILKEYIEKNRNDLVHVLSTIKEEAFPFGVTNSVFFSLLYPYEEPPEELMSNRQLAEWVAKANGQYTSEHWTTVYTEHAYYKDCADEKVPSDYRIRPWGSDEWIEPTEEIYLRDCR